VELTDSTFTRLTALLGRSKRISNYRARRPGIRQGRAGLAGVDRRPESGSRLGTRTLNETVEISRQLKSIGRHWRLLR
jgi:hypothetical protein